MQELTPLLLDIQEAYLIKLALGVVENSIERGDIDDITSNSEELTEFYSQGYFDDLVRALGKIGA